MDYEWDETKREANLAKHGLDFVLAPLIHEADFKLTIPSPRDKEVRWVDVAEVDGETLVLTLGLHPARQSGSRHQSAQGKSQGAQAL